MTTRRFANSLRVKVAIGVALPVFLALAALSTVQYLRERRILLDQLEAAAVHLGQVMRGSLRHAMLTRDQDEEQQTLMDISQLESVQRIAIFDGLGRLRAADNLAEFDPPPERSDPGCVECHQPGGVLVLHSIPLDLPGREPVLRSSTLIPNEPACHECHGTTQPFLGVLIADFSLHDLERQASDSLRLSLGLSALATVLITTGVYGQVHTLVVRRVERFQSPLRHFAHGDFASRVPLEPGEGDELGQLAGAVNRMAEGLSQQADLERRARQARQEAIAEERQRLARELHDGLAQVLGYLNTKMMAIRLLLARGQNEKAAGQLQELEQTSRGLFRDIRQSILDLKTPVGGERSFAEALEDYLLRVHGQSGIPVALDLGGGQGLTLDAETELQLLRIVQEALANVRNHAGATRAWVCLEPNGGREAALTVADNGRGFDLAANHNSDGHFGLSTMRERAEVIGGTLTVASAPGAGTKVIVKFPLAGGAGEDERDDNARSGG